MSTQQIWEASFLDPTRQRRNKPRQTGKTMLIDKGVSLSQFEDLLYTSSTYLDYIKLGFGTAVLYPADILKQKIKLAQQYQVTIYTGGTFFELAYSQGKMATYFNNLLEWGFRAVEISDGTISINPDERQQAIRLALEMGFEVVTECGKKKDGSFLDVNQIEEMLLQDLEAGASYMIVEGRESGQNVGIYSSTGEIDPFFLHQIQGLGERTQALHHLIWEAPLKKQQVALLQHLGRDVNFGNIAPEDLYSLEALRRGLRSDTFFQE